MNNRGAKIFLDVGGHEGQTLEEVLKPDYRFDIIHCFEPMPESFAILTKKFADHIGGKLVLHNVGLADFDGMRTLYGSNQDAGASLFKEKQNLDRSDISTECRFMRASRFFDDHVKKDSLIVMKLNCEGGEVLILDDLLTSRKIHDVDNVMIDFDIRKVPSRRGDAQKMLARLKKAGFRNYILVRQAMIGRTHQARIRFWLSGLSFAENVMALTPSEKRARSLPAFLRVLLARLRKKLKF